MTDVLSGLISIPDAAPKLGVSVRTAWQYKHDKKIRWLQYNGRIYTRQEWIDEFFEQLITQAESTKTVPHLRAKSGTRSAKKQPGRTAKSTKKTTGKNSLYKKSRSKRGPSQ